MKPRGLRTTSDIERLEGRSVMAFAGLAEALPRFDTVEEVKDFLVEKALKDYSYQFGQPTYGYYPLMMNDSVASSQMRGPTSTEGNSGDGAVVPDHSTTNTQVAGVDEADLVETDGRYLYVARNGEVVIASALASVSGDAFNGAGSEGGSGLDVVSRIAIQGNVAGQFLAGDRLTVISTQWYGWGVDPMFGRMAVSALPYSPSMRSQSAVTVSVFDVGDPSVPTLLEQTKMDGEFLEARAIEDKVFVIVSNSDLVLPPPRMICPDRDPTGIPLEGDSGDSDSGSDGAGSDGAAGEADSETELGADEWMPIAFASKPDDEPTYRTFSGGLMMAAPMVGDALPEGRFAYWEGPACVYEDRETYLAGIMPRLDALVDGLLPQYSAMDGTASFVRGGALHEPGDIIRPVNDQTSRLLSVVSFDVFDDQAGPVAAEAIPTSWASAFMASADHLYVFQSDYSSMGEGPSTDILRFTWNTATGEIRATAAGSVPGSTLNQFSADEYEGRLRVATTSSKQTEEGWRAENGVYVLEGRGAQLAIVGSVTGIAPGENIYSVRFAGDRGFVVTFRQVDPFYTLDLSDPTAPKVVGELKIPGYSSYLQVLDETHVVGIGRVDIGDWQWRVQVSVFDISNFADPKRVGLYTFDETVSGSPAEWEHLAFLWVPSLKLLAFPVNAARYSPPAFEMPPEAPIVIDDGSSGDGSFSGDDATDTLAADGEDDEVGGDDSAGDVGDVGEDAVNWDGSEILEKGEPMLFTTTAMPLDSWYSGFEDLSGLAFLRVDFAAADEASGLTFEGIVRQSGTMRSVWIGDHVYAISPAGILALNATADHELVGGLDFGPEPGADNTPMVFPAMYWRGMEPLMASANQPVEAAAESTYVDPQSSPSPWDDTMLSDVLQAAVADLATRLDVPTDGIRLVTAECAGIDDATGGKVYDLVFSASGQRHHVRAVLGFDGTVSIEQFTANYAFATDSTSQEWHNAAEPCDVDGDGLVAPVDALNVINELNRKGSYRLSSDRPMRSIAARSIGTKSAFAPVRVRFDSNSDNMITPIDALIIINRLNSASPNASSGGASSGGASSGGSASGSGGEGEAFGGGGTVAASLPLFVGPAAWDSANSGGYALPGTLPATNSVRLAKPAASVAFQDAALTVGGSQAEAVHDELLAGWDALSDDTECLGALGDAGGLASIDASLSSTESDSVIPGM